MPQFMCQFGNCQETETLITVNIKDTVLGERARFCTFAHLALWAKSKAKRRQDVEADKISIDDQIELGMFKPKEQ